MKKILSLLAVALLTGSLNAHAQLGDLLGSLSKVVYAYTGNTEAVDLPGTWTYQGPALALDIVAVWLATSFEGGRHQRRIDKITAC